MPRPKIDPHVIDQIAYLSKLDRKLDPVQVREEYVFLKSALADLYLADRATFAIAAELVKEKLGIGRRDLEADLKPIRVNLTLCANWSISPFPIYPDRLLGSKGLCKFFNEVVLGV